MNRAVLRALFDSMDVGTVRTVFGDEWQIAHAPAGWLAVRHGGGIMHEDGPESLLQAAVFAESLGDLIEQLCVQTTLYRLSPDELVHVYATGKLPDDLSCPPDGPMTGPRPVSSCSRRPAKGL
jgi:hypothetical protein